LTSVSEGAGVGNELTIKIEAAEIVRRPVVRCILTGLFRVEKVGQMYLMNSKGKSCSFVLDEPPIAMGYYLTFVLNMGDEEKWIQWSIWKLKIDTVEHEWDLGWKSIKEWRSRMDSMELNMENDQRMEVKYGDE
jgi:hypothetical protein